MKEIGIMHPLVSRATISIRDTVIEYEGMRKITWDLKDLGPDYNQAQLYFICRKCGYKLPHRIAQDSIKLDDSIRKTLSSFSDPTNSFFKRNDILTHYIIQCPKCKQFRFEYYIDLFYISRENFIKNGAMKL